MPFFRLIKLSFQAIRRNTKRLFFVLGMLLIIQSVEAKPVPKETVFKGIEFEQLFSTVIEEFRKVGFEFKESKKFDAPFGFTLENDFVYLPKFSENDSGSSSARLLIVKQSRGTDDQESADTHFKKQ
ncbi:hypothetical protein RF679_18600 [Undibacterium cyanobacteriorum]|uniref:Uncharacterized protein n=1 Tax=Undibacterium cyanobacteriorum TaxID=3073561 RepID=A0ABY9RHG1_9BURK|nr:hypothetical protein [Undibacterium sp. 20NA77.5]WMW80627.1 hypothetical protein RF679_18600 [Undibacterium sp. 20NA77.5]